MRKSDWLLVSALMLGCTVHPMGGEHSTETGETGISTGDETDSETTAASVPACVEDECDMACTLELDECGEPMVGHCESKNTCTCYEDEWCIDCESSADCGQWEQCHREFGCTVCWTTTTVDWDPALDCTFDLSAATAVLIPYIRVEIDTMPVPTTATCVTMLAGMVWLEGMHLQLCPDTCTKFEQAGSLDITIGCPGGP